MTRTGWTVFGALALNLALFIFVTSLPAFRDLHHHWIFPVLGAVFAAQWALAGGLARLPALEGSADPAALRAALLSLLAFLIAMGIVRHQTILACFGRCSFKLGGAAALAGAVFAGQARLRDAGFWGPQRALAAALGCGFWAVFLFFYGCRAPAWAQDAVVAAGAAALLPLWAEPAVTALLLAAGPALIARRLLGEHGLIFLGLALACGGLWFAGRAARKT